MKKRIYKKHIRAHAAVILSLFMMLSLIGSGFPFSGAELNSTFTYAASQTAGDFEYTVSGGTVTLTAYNGKDAAPKIPASIGGNKVTAIGPECFRGNAKITTINVPEGITSIGDYAFEACSSATSLTLPSTLQTIGKAAFSGDGQIEKIEIPKNVSKIGDGAFLYCRKVQSITGGEGLTELGQFVFAGCEIASEVDLSNASHLKDLPDRTFCNCMSLFKVKLPDSIETVGKRAFSYCSALGTLEFGPNVNTVGDYAFEKCSGLTEVSFEGSEGLKLGSNEFASNDGVVPVHLILPNDTVITDTTFSGTKLGGVYVSGDGNLIFKSGEVSKVRLIKNGQIYEDDGEVLVNALPERYDSDADKWIPVTETVEDGSYTRYSVDSNVRKIADGAFNETTFDVVILHDGIDELDDKAFYGAEIKAIAMDGDSSKFIVKDGMLYEKAEAESAGNGGLGADLGSAGNSAAAGSSSEADNTVSSDADSTTATDSDSTGVTDTDNATATDADNATGSTPASETDTTSATDADNTAATDTDSAAAEDSNADVTAGNGEEASANEDTAGKETVEEGTGNDAAPPKLLLGAAGAGDKYRLLRFFKYKEEDNKLVRITEKAEGVPDSGPTQKFIMPADVVSIAPYAFSNAGVHIDVANASSLRTFEEYSFTNSGICDPSIVDDDAEYYGSIINYDAIKGDITIEKNAFAGYGTYFPYEDEEGDPDPQTLDDLTGDDTPESERDFNDRFARIRDDRRKDGDVTPYMPDGDGDPGEPDSTVTFTSESGSKSLYSDRKYSGYQVIPNSGFPAWSQKYIDHNKADIEFTQDNMPYTMLYKGEAHYRSMVCVLNNDEYKKEYSIRNVGDDFAPMYLTMDHALEAEIQRGGVPDDIVLYSGITVERMADIAGTDKSVTPTKEQLINAIGREFTDPAFMSTTTNPSIAASFSSHSNTMIVIYASSEALSKLGAVVIDSFSGWGAGEYEILLNLGAKFKVLDVGTLQVDSGGETQYERQYIRLQLMVDDETSSITYDLNGGSYNGSTDNIVEKHKTGDVITVHDAPVREGYTFSYWKGSEYHPGETYVVNGGHTFTAVWVANEDGSAADSSDDDSGDDGGKKAVKTGDESNLTMWLILLMIAAVCECGIIYARRRR